MPDLVPVDHDPFADAGSTGPQLVPVDHDPFATMGAGEDIARTIGPALTRGTAYLAGAPGDIQHMAKSGADWVGDQLGGDKVSDQTLSDQVTGAPPKKAEGGLASIVQWLKDESAKSAKYYHGSGDLPGSYELPTSDQLIHGVEKVTGPLHHAETTPGKFVEKPLEFVPSVLAPEARIPKLASEIVPALIQGGKNIIKRAVGPGVASEAAGEATEGTPFEPWARAGSAILAHGGTELASNLISGPSTAEAAIAAKLPAGVTPSHVLQAEGLIRQAQQKGISLTWPEALSQVTGKPVLSDAMRLAESSPHSRDITQDYFAQRPEQIKNAAANEFQNIGPTHPNPSYLGPQVADAATQTINNIRANINKATKPSYDAAGQTLVPQAVHAQAMADPLFAHTLAEVRNNPELNSYLHGMSDRSVAVYDAVKQQLEQRSRNLANPTNPGASQVGSSVTGSLANEVKGAAIDASRAAANGPTHYERALGEQARLRDTYLNPVLAGPLGKIADAPTTKAAVNALFPANPLPNSQGEISKTVGSLSKKNPMAAAQLVRAHAEMTFNEAAQRLIPGENQMGGAKFAATIAGNDQQRANLQAAIEALPNGKARWTGFENFLDIVEATGTRQPKGSLTSFNEREMQSMSTGAGGKVALAAKHGLAPGEWWHIAHDALGKWQLGKNMKSLATILTNPNSGPLLQKLVSLPKQSSQAGAVAARLIAQVGSARSSSKPAEPTE